MNTCSSEHFLGGLCFCCLFFGKFCSFERFFFRSPSKTKVLLGLGHASVFGILWRGGFSQDFWIFWNFRSSEHFLFSFCFVYFFNFLQFRTPFFKTFPKPGLLLELAVFFVSLDPFGMVFPGLLDFVFLYARNFCNSELFLFDWKM